MNNLDITTVPLVHIDGVNIPFDPLWKNIAVSVSGGADSALLACILMELIDSYQCDTTVHFISHIRCWKTRPWQQYDSLNVYNYLVKKYPKIKTLRHISFIAPELEYGSVGPTMTDEYGKTVSGDNIQQRAFAEYACTQYSVDCYYNGVTKNPPLNLPGSMPSRFREKTADLEKLELMVHLSFYASHPLRFTDKSWVMRQYSTRDLYTLLDITRSCEGEFKNIDYKSYTPGQYVPLCHNCFWCLEREWAINESK